MKSPQNICDHELHGAVTVGERGQVVIPQALRQRMKIKAGDRLYVVSKHDAAVLLIREAEMRQFVSKYEQAVDAHRDLRNLVASTRKSGKKV